MKFQLPGRAVVVFFILTLCVALTHLLTRVHLPLQVDERPFSEFNSELQLSATEPNGSFIAMLAKYNAPPVDDSKPVSLQFDGRKLGEQYVELLGIYQTEGNYRAILSLHSASTKEKQLIRLGLQEEFAGLRLTEIKARNITIEFEKQSVTLRLFHSNQQGSALAH